MKMGYDIRNFLNEFCMIENERLSEMCNYRYEILHLSDITGEVLNMAYSISKFYNENYFGNEDYMHIPDFKQTVENIIKYPIIVARENGSDDILGVSILKYFDSNDVIDPYFPVRNSRYFSVTGILTNIHNREKGYYGIGKKIYEIILNAVCKYKELSDNDIRLMCVIDCRNNNSIDALRIATENLNKKYNSKKMETSIVGYYEVESLYSGLLVEAPTFVIEMKMDNFVNNKCQNIELKYDSNASSKEESYFKMKDLINKLFVFNNDVSIRNVDEECGLVIYHSLLSNNYVLENIKIDANGTELGNDRKPISNEEFDLDVTKYICTVIRNDLTGSSVIKTKKLARKHVSI